MVVSKQYCLDRMVKLSSCGACSETVPEEVDYRTNVRVELLSIVDDQGDIGIRTEALFKYRPENVILCVLITFDRQPQFGGNSAFEVEAAPEIVLFNKDDLDAFRPTIGRN